MEERHIPVLLKETVDLLDITSGDTVLDCTFGRGGHSAVLLDLVQPNGKLIGIDADQEAAHFAANFTDKSNFVFVQSNFRHLDRVLVSLGIPKVDKILFDLGVSSPQLDDSGRGFSYKYDAQLDMRLNKDQSISAWTIVNNATEEELAKILWTFGEERWAKRIANFIVTSRSAQPIQTTLELVDIIKGAIPKAVREAEDQHPARRTFQAIRIAVNDELGALAQALDKAVAALAREGRLAVITFHSLEDRIVKQTFQKYVAPCLCPPGLPACVCGKVPTLAWVVKKPIVPNEQEISRNPRSRSAKLRVVKKI